MSIYRHRPGAPLDAYVDWLWYYEDYFPDHQREHVLPDGTFELMLNLQERPRKLFDRRDASRYQSFRRGWISGTHSSYLVIDALPASSMIGVHFKPGGAAPFLGLPAGELDEAVVELDGLWGDGVWEWRDRLLESKGAAKKFRVIERLLLARLSKSRRQPDWHQGVAWSVTRFIDEPHLRRISEVPDHLGISHKHFIQQFRNEVGMAPKLFCRIRRFQQVVGRIAARREVEWADLACSCGYYDQAHFVNDFTAFCGINPTGYLRQRLKGEPNFMRAL